MLGLRSGDLLGTLRGGCFGGQAFFLLTGGLGGFTGGAGSLLLGGFGGGLAGCSGTGRSGSFGSSLPVFGDDQRRRYADADGEFLARLLCVEPDGRFILEDQAGKVRGYLFKEVQYIL